MNQQKIGKFIKERRKSKNLTQSQLSEKLGVSNRTVSKWKNGNSMPDYSLFMDLCKELDITANELLEGEKLSHENYSKIIAKPKNRYKFLIIIIVPFLLLYFLYKLFAVYYFSFNDEKEINTHSFPYDNISVISIEKNNKANTLVDDIDIYIPNDYKKVTDKEEFGYVTDKCNTYIKGLKDKYKYDYMIMVCFNNYPNLDNLEEVDLHSTLLPLFDIKLVLEKNHINNTLDLIKYYEKNSNFKPSFFSSLNDLKINFIAKRYVDRVIPPYDNFYYLENDLEGYATERTLQPSIYIYEAVLSIYKDNNERKVSISFRSDNKEFDKDEITKILSSIKSR